MRWEGRRLGDRKQRWCLVPLLLMVVALKESTIAPAHLLRKITRHSLKSGIDIGQRKICFGRVGNRNPVRNRIENSPGKTKFFQKCAISHFGTSTQLLHLCLRACGHGSRIGTNASMSATPRYYLWNRRQSIGKGSSFQTIVLKVPIAG